MMTTKHFLQSFKCLLLALVATTHVHSFSNVAPPSKTSCTQNTLSDEQLVELAKEYVENQNGFYHPVDMDAHAEDFVYRGGYIGPLNKVDYCNTMTKLGVADAFDLQSNAFGFCVDPDNKNMARFFVRYTGTQVKTWDVVGTPVLAPLPDKNTPVVGPTESLCVQFNDDAKVKFFAISAPMAYGNPEQPTTGQYGALLGLLSHVGLNFFADSATYDNVLKMGNAASSMLPNNVSPPLSASKQEDVPTWWKEN
jgi:hypothetical protein